MEYQNELFNFLYPDKNDELSKMNNKDLDIFLNYMKNYYLSLRNKLEFSDQTTFGIELEFEYADLQQIDKNIKKTKLRKSWYLHTDQSLKKGGEVSSPILKNSEETWLDILNMCNCINQNALIMDHSAGHIHIGAQEINNSVDSWLQFIKLWATYENVIFRFLYGEYLTARSSLNTYASPLRNNFKYYCKLLTTKNNYEKQNNVSYNEYNFINKQILSSIDHKRNQAVNFNHLNTLGQSEINNTIEFRCPNGTLNPVVWQNNINMLVHLLDYSNNTAFNMDIVEARERMNEQNLFLDYNLVYLNQALEFVDLIFENNLDKIYFLKQYLKSFEIDNKPLKKAKPFTLKK